MKLKLSEGCYGPTLIIDDKDNWNDMDIDYKLLILKQVLDKIYHEADLDGLNIMYDLLGILTPVDFKYDEEPCDQCGTYYEEYTYEV